jgi:hypothetical protein
MIALDGELQHTERIARRRRQGGGDRREYATGPQRREACGCAQRDVNGAPGIVRATAAMPDTTSAGARLSPGAFPRATPIAFAQRERELSTAVFHLNRQ